MSVQLRNALALCHVLNRTLILPNLTSGVESWWSGDPQGSVRSTPADFVLDLERSDFAWPALRALVKKGKGSDCAQFAHYCAVVCINGIIQIC